MLCEKRVSIGPLLHGDGDCLLAWVASDGDYDGLVAGRDVGRDYYVELQDAGDEAGGFAGEGVVGSLTADGEGNGQQRRGGQGEGRSGRGGHFPGDAGGG